MTEVYVFDSESKEWKSIASNNNIRIKLDKDKFGAEYKLQDTENGLRIIKEDDADFSIKPALANVILIDSANG